MERSKLIGATKSPRECGMLDSYYRRGVKPHYYVEGNRFATWEMTADQLEEYRAGYDENELNGDYKDWG